MKVFVCIPCLCLGGSEIATLQMVQALTADGHQLRVIVYYEHDAKMVARYEAAGAQVQLLNERRGGLRGLWRLLRRLAKLFRAERPEVVHGVYFAPGMIPLLAARLAGVPRVFATVHAAGGRGYGWKAKLLFRVSALLTTHFFCVAENTERFWFGSVGGKRHSTIHNGIDLETFANAKPAEIPGIAPGDLVVGIVGSIIELKGHDCLFRAVCQLISEYSDIKILIIGEGNSQPKLEKLASDLKIDTSIIWIGRIEPELLPSYYKAMKLLVMPSHWEGFGLAAAEAMAAGVPVIASNVPGLCEVVGKSGLIFPVGNDLALKECIKNMIQNHIKYSDLAKQQVLKFDLKEQLAKWENYYRQI